MAVVKNYKPKTIYMPPRIKSRLESIFDFNYTVVEAPTGYGKTTIIKEFLNNQKKPYIWFNIDNDNKEQFFSDLCSRLNSIDKEAASKLRLEGFPFDLDSYKRIARILININLEEKTILVLDNYHYISFEFFNKVFKDVTANKDSKLNIIVLTQEIKSGAAFDLIYKKQMNYISKNDFEFSKDEIKKYCKTCGISLESDEIEFLYNYTEGWISAIYLQLLNYMSIGKFELTESINTLVVKGIWDRLDEIEKDFLISISIFDSFSLKKASNIYKDKLSINEIKEILDKNEFVRYDSKEREYHIHALLKYFLKEELEKTEHLYKQALYKKVGDWYAVNDDYFTAIKYYHEIKEYDSILSMEYNIGELISHANKSNKAIFMDVVTEVSLEAKKKYASKYLMYLTALFLYNERSLLLSECKIMNGIIKNDLLLLGELKIVEATSFFNDINSMRECLTKAEEYLQGPSKVFYKYCNLLFGCPSALALYHNKVGELDVTIKQIDDTVPYIYRLSGGSGKGTEALMRGQALFFRGDYESAEILAHKAIYMAETRSQLTVYVGAIILLAKIQIFNGDSEAYKDSIQKIKTKVRESDDLFVTNTSDLALGDLGTVIEQVDLIPEWLKKSDSIENNSNLITLGFANCIYGKYLILENQYSKLLGISGQFIGVANIFSSVVYQIYTYIYIAIANRKLGNDEKAVNFLTEAIELAIPDGLYIPFVENFSSIEEITLILPNDTKQSIFLKKSNTLARNLEKGKEIVVRSINSDKNHGLTKRESDVAKLAAIRMTNREIADKLFIAESTVKSNMKIIFNKLGINSRSELKEYF